MNAALAPVSDVQEAAWHSEDLSGSAVPGEMFAAFSFEELVEVGSSRLQDAEAARRDFLHCLLAIMRLAGESPSNRRSALNEYAKAIGWPHTWRYLHKFAALALTIHPQELQDRFPDVTVGHALLAVEGTAIPGEAMTAPERRERAYRVLESAADQGLTQDATRRLAREVRDQEIRGPVELSDIERIVNVTPVPPADWDAFWAELLGRFKKQMKADRPGTDSLVLECLDSLKDDLRGRWRVSPNG
jgi:hypothetical protein